MTYWNGHGMNGWGWFAMSLGMALLWALLIVAGVLIVRAVGRVPGAPHPPDGRPSAELLLGERFARGDIDEDEYRRRLAVLRGDVPHPGGHSP
ncbi:SHOCT domain-containing protein [Streptomyces marokkonensis]|uniref:SHOCT domain-containing protein n=1 Tax=Streptomyces marokkonensis TaxID=324855 RepID=A0ABW6QI11_9ACTN